MCGGRSVPVSNRPNLLALLLLLLLLLLVLTLRMVFVSGAAVVEEEKVVVVVVVIILVAVALSDKSGWCCGGGGPAEYSRSSRPDGKVLVVKAEDGDRLVSPLPPSSLLEAMAKVKRVTFCGGLQRET